MYVIRSMSTTDASFGRKPEPYHIYLLKPEKRRGAYWSTSKIDAVTFETVEAALAHGAQALPDNDRFDVVPMQDAGVPTYWDARNTYYRARVIGTEITLPEWPGKPKPMLVEHVPEFAEWGPKRPNS